MLRSQGLWVLVALVAACGGKPAVTKAPPVAKKTKKAPPAKLGAACHAPSMYAQGSCGKGLMCAQSTGGACVGQAPCGEGSALVETVAMGEVCLKACNADEDCRGAEGYKCDAQWKTCAVANFLAPKAPECPGLPPGHKTFGHAQQISTKEGPGAYHVEPTAAFNKKGELAIVYVAAAAGGKPNGLGVLAIGGKGGVFDLGEVKGSRPNELEPRVVADRNGKLYMVWLAFDGAKDPPAHLQIELATSDDGKSWSKPIAATNLAQDCPDDTPGCIDKPIVAVGPDKAAPDKDSLYISYYSKSADALKMIKSTDGGATFSAPAKVGAGRDGDVQLTASGGIHVVYVAVAPSGNLFGDATSSIQYVKSTDGGATFTPPVAVSAPGEAVPFYFSNPQVIPDLARKMLYVVYPAGTPDGNWSIMLATSKDGGSTWSRIKVNDDEACANHMVPTAALENETGRLHIIWTENRGGVGGVAYTRCEKLGTKCSRNEGVSDLPFSAYRMVRHSPKWLGEQNVLLLDETNKVMHAMWTQPVDEGGKMVSRIFYASGKITK